MLNDEKFCDLVYREYRAEHAEIENVYKRYQVAVASIAALGAILGATTKPELLSLCWTRIDVFLYYLFAGLTGMCLVASGGCLIASIMPREFQTLNRLESWQRWRADYRDELAQLGYGGDDRSLVDAAVARATCEQATQRLAEATDWNVTKNRMKMKWFNYCFYLTVLSVALLGLQVVMQAILFLNKTKAP